MVFGPRVRGEIVFGGPISDPGLRRSVKEILDEFFKLRMFKRCCETATGMVYDHRETGLYTNGVRTVRFVRKGRRTLVTVRSGECAQGLKPRILHRSLNSGGS